MQKETTMATKPSVREFVVPIELLKTFKADIRVLPPHLPTNGYIGFDQDMLVAVLRSNNKEERENLANQLDKLGKAGGELVIMQTQQG